VIVDYLRWSRSGRAAAPKAAPPAPEPAPSAPVPLLPWPLPAGPGSLDAARSPRDPDPRVFGPQYEQLGDRGGPRHHCACGCGWSVYDGTVCWNCGATMPADQGDRTT